jgi:hypothetical protein
MLKWLIILAIVILYLQLSTRFDRAGSEVRDELLEKYGDFILDLSIAHKGSSSRIKNKILQASNGKPIKFGVIGGSISTGHTLQDSKETYHSLVFNWWNKKFPKPSLNAIVNGAVPATGSSYFTYCHDKHIPNIFNQRWKYLPN